MVNLVAGALLVAGLFVLNKTSKARTGLAES